MNRKLLLLCLLLVPLLLAACASAGDPADTVERYLTAKVSRDEATISALLCTEMEADLPREAQSFASVSDARIEAMQCSANAGADSVTCSGQIVAVYGTGDSASDVIIPLVTYRVVQEDGEWKWCGETAPPAP